MATILHAVSLSIIYVFHLPIDLFILHDNHRASYPVSGKKHTQNDYTHECLIVKGAYQTVAWHRV